MIRYKHKEIGLFLVKVKSGYSSLYKLNENGTIWNKDCIKTLGLRISSGQRFNADDFEKVEVIFTDTDKLKIAMEALEIIKRSSKCLRSINIATEALSRLIHEN